MTPPLVSVVIAAKNAEATLAKCLDSVFKQRYPYYEVVVVNDGSKDNTAAIAAQYPRLMLVNTENAGCSGARNLGVGLSHGEYIAFLDSDAFVDSDWLEELLTGFTDERVAGVGGIQKSPADEHPFGKKVQKFFLIFGFISNYMQTSDRIKEVDHNANCNVIYRKSAFDEVGGLWAIPLAGEDIDLDHRLREKGYRLMMNPRAVIFHYRTRTFKGFAGMMFRYGMGQGRLVRMYGMFRLVHWLPLLTVGGSILFIVEIFAHTTWTGLFAGVLFLGLLCRLSFDGVLLCLSGIGFMAWHGGFIKGLFMRNRETHP